MFVSINHLGVPDGRESEISSRFDQVKGHLEKADGFLRFRLLRPQSDGAKWLVYTEWETAADYDGWKNSPLFGRMHPHHGSPHDAPISASAEVVTYDVVTDCAP